MRTVMLSVLMLLSFGAALRAIPAEAQPQVVLRGEKVAVEAECRDGRLRERYLAIRDGTWVEVVTGDQGRSIGPVSVVIDGGKSLPGTVRNVSLAEGALVEELTAGQHRMIRKLTITGDGSWIRVVTRFEPSSRVALHQLADRFKFPHQPDWSFSPSVGGCNPDAQYKAPLILVQADRAALGIVPDLAVLRREELKRCNHALDLDVPGGPMLAVGFLPARLASHSVYALDPGRTWDVDQAVENVYYLLVTASAVPGQAYRQAIRFHWSQFGRAEQAHAADEQVGTDPRYRKLALWDDWRKTVWDEESPRTWLAVPLADGSIGGGCAHAALGSGSLGLPVFVVQYLADFLRHGPVRQAHRQRQTPETGRTDGRVGVKAPGRDGAFKCVAVPLEGGKPPLWAAGDGSGGSTKDGFLGYDMCWTSYWLLKWRAAQLPGSEDILPRCRQLARFLIAHQATDGMLPTRFAEDGSVQEEASRTVKAETGPVILFLLELYAQDPNPVFLEAARHGMEFLERQVIPHAPVVRLRDILELQPAPGAV